MDHLVSISYDHSNPEISAQLKSNAVKLMGLRNGTFDFQAFHIQSKTVHFLFVFKEERNLFVSL